VSPGDAGSYYVTTKSEAIRQAREARAAGDENVSVTAVEVTGKLPRRTLYCRLLNNEGFAVKHTEVWS